MNEGRPANALSFPTAPPSGPPGGAVNPPVISPAVFSVRSPQVVDPAPTTRGTATSPGRPLQTYSSKAVQTTPSINRTSQRVIEPSPKSEGDTQALAKGKDIPVNLASTGEQ